MNWKILSFGSGSKKMPMILIPFLFSFLPLLLFGKSILPGDPPPEAWEQVTPYLMTDSHPLKHTLDALFSQSRVIQDRNSLIKAGFDDAKPQHATKVIVTRHSQMPGYVFKLYTDDQLFYYREKPEYTIWMLRARGAALVRQEIAKQGWQAYFKAPIKWIYALPVTPRAKPGHLQKNFILVEEDMEILRNKESRKRWQDGSISHQQLRMLFHLLTAVGLHDSCTYPNIPICKDGRIAFVDTQSNLHWPLPYHILLRVLNEDLSALWNRLIEESKRKGWDQKRRG